MAVQPHLLFLLLPHLAKKEIEFTLETHPRDAAGGKQCHLLHPLATSSQQVPLPDCSPVRHPNKFDIATTYNDIRGA
eukprot:1110807-Pelagomonas_calceolata.AAC.3